MKENTEDYEDSCHYTKYVRPLSARLLKTLKLDKCYHKAQGRYLYYKEANNKSVRVMDYVGGYGSVILGHNHPEIVQEAMQLLQKSVPIHAQMSIRTKAAELAKIISNEIEKNTRQRYITTLANSGAEAVEAALKHARLAYNKKIIAIQESIDVQLSLILASLYKKGINIQDPILVNGEVFESFVHFKNTIVDNNKKTLETNYPLVMAAEGAFHGKTLAALAITYKTQFRLPYLPTHSETIFFPINSSSIETIFSDALKTLLVPVLTTKNQIKIENKSFSRIAAIIVEPVQGEAGAIPISCEVLQTIAQQAKRHDVPLIFDEIQTGVYRTGCFLASFESGVYADYYLLGKSLGGGIAKISALIINEKIYQEEFGLDHTSTFSEDDFSSAIAIKALELTRGKIDVINNLAEILKNALEKLQQQYPMAIISITGRGLMLAIEFKDFKNSKSYAFQMLSRSGYLGYVIAGYLLNNYKIRVAPPLSTTTSIRIQPSILFKLKDIEHLIFSLEQLCKVIIAEDLYKLIEYTLDFDEQNLRELIHYKHGDIERSTTDSKLERVGFLTHFIDVDGVKIADPSLAVLTDASVESLLASVIDVSKPILLGIQTISNKFGAQVEIVQMGLCFTSSMALKALRENKANKLRQLCHDAVKQLDQQYNVNVVGLGQFTSILTQDGRSIPNSKIKITTGNSFTIQVGVQALWEKISCKQHKSATKLGVIGAGGNISSTYAQCFTNKISEIHLLGGTQSTSHKKAVRTAGKLVLYVFEQLQRKREAESPLEERLFQSDLFKRSSTLRFSPQTLWQKLCEELGDTNPIKVAYRIEEIKDCHVVVVATNSSVAFLKPEHFQPDAIILDISVPVNCTKELLENKKGISVLYGGIVDLPQKEKIQIRGFPLDDGQTYACMADTLILGFEKTQASCSFGLILPDQVARMGALGDKHGFRCSGSKSSSSF